MDAATPAQSEESVQDLLKKEAVTPKEQQFPVCPKSSGYKLATKPAFFASAPSIVAALPLTRECSSSMGLAAGSAGLGSTAPDEAEVQVRCLWCSSPQKSLLCFVCLCFAD